jgi:uncharacterized protein (UPF0248 family)
MVGGIASTVIPIQDLLQRIRWDPAFGGSTYEIGYLDHVGGRVVRVPLCDNEVVAAATPRGRS